MVIAPLSGAKWLGRPTSQGVNRPELMAVIASKIAALR
jgi:hypothetical protein